MYSRGAERKPETGQSPFVVCEWNSRPGRIGSTVLHVVHVEFHSVFGGKRPEEIPLIRGGNDRDECCADRFHLRWRNFSARYVDMARAADVGRRAVVNTK